MTIEELADKLIDKSSEVYWEHCNEEVQDEDSQLAVRYWEGWSDALDWAAQAIRDGCLDVFELKHPIWIGEHDIDGKHKVFYKYPPDWSEEQKEAWRRGHGG